MPISERAPQRRPPQQQPVCRCDAALPGHPTRNPRASVGPTASLPRALRRPPQWARNGGCGHRTMRPPTRRGGSPRGVFFHVLVTFINARCTKNSTGILSSQTNEDHVQEAVVEHPAPGQRRICRRSLTLQPKTRKKDTSTKHPVVGLIVVYE